MSAIEEFVESLSLFIYSHHSICTININQCDESNLLQRGRELAHISPSWAVSKRNKYAVTADITQWKGDQFLMV